MKTALSPSPTINFPSFGLAIDHPKKTALALVLAVCMACTGCWFNPAWLQDALNDLPVLVQMAQAILEIVAVTKTDAPPSATDIAAINQIGYVATQGLTAIQNLCKSYTSANSTTTIADIRAAGAALVANLNTLLSSAQIKDPALLVRVSTAVNLIVTTVNTIIGLLPASPSAADMKAAKARATSGATKLPKPADLRAMWQQEVGFALGK
jgi:hypothetical protein